MPSSAETSITRSCSRSRAEAGPLPFLAQGAEPNPALGVRGLRIARAHPEILDGQLAALAAAAQGVPGCDLWVMAPMVATPAEAAGFVSQARAAEVALAADSPAAGRGAVRALTVG